MMIKSTRFFVILWACFVAEGALGYTLSGTVYGNGHPLAGASVKVTLAVDESVIGQATTNEQGLYTITVEDGTYNMLVKAPEGSSGYGTSIINGIAVAGFDVIRNFALVTGPSKIYGVIRLPDGSPIPEVLVRVREEATDYEIGLARSDMRGNFEIFVLNGAYRFDFEYYRSEKNKFIGSPTSFEIYRTLQNTIVQGPLSLDITIPFSWLSGATKDSNAVPVSDVAFELRSGGGNYVDIPKDSPSWELWRIRFNPDPIVSTKQGQYTLALFDAADYDLAVIPRPESGFASSLVKALRVNGPTPLDVIFQKPDHIPPKFIAGPLATNISQNQATLAWETDEPARGSVTMAGNSITEDSYRTQHGVLLTGLTPSTDYTATVTATDRSGNGPTTANAAFKTLAVPDTASPIITAGPSVAFYDPYTTIINWETNEPATTRVSGDATYEDGGFVKIHAAELYDLTASNEYNVTISSTDAAGNAPVTRDISFTTPPASDTLAPVITKGPWSVDITSNAATVAWETDEPANSGLSYNDGTAYEVLNDDALTLSHAVRLTRLKPNTAYNVTVSSKDSSGNGPTLSETFVIRTLAETDTQPPVFLNPPAACNVNQQLIQLCFDTDEPSSVVVHYGVVADQLNKSEAVAQLRQDHTLSINGLVPSTSYYFRVSVKDQAGNEAVSDVLQVTTLATSSSDPRFVSAPVVSYQGEDRAVIQWETDRPCIGFVEYGVKNYNSQVSSSELAIKHSLVLSKLKSATTYQFRVTATDVDGRKAVVSSSGSSSVKAQLSKLVTASATTGELTTGSKTDKTAPTITKAPEVIDANGVIEIQWSTNEAADSRIYFGKKSETIRRVAGEIDFATSHKVRLPAVTPASDYSFRIVTVDPAGNAYTSPDYDLTSAPSAFSLTVTKSGSGTVTSNPVGINCGDDCEESYASGALVTLVAIPNAEHSFNGWGGACSGASTCVLTMSAAKNVTAEFSAITPGSFPVTVSKSGGGTVTSVPAGVDCGPVCSFEFKTGTSASLTATAEPGYQFDGWAGDCTGASTCVLTINSAKTVTASFVLTGSSTTFPLTTSVSGSGTITSNPAGIACGTDCSEDYPANTAVTLTATPVAGHSFSGWSGDCAGTGSCVVTMTSAKRVSAAFEAAQSVDLKISRQPNGTVVSDPNGINCGMANRSCKASFGKDSTVMLTAQPREGFLFKKWKGCTSSDGNSCQIIVSNKKTTVSPVFVPLPKYKLTINKNRYGSVISSLGKPKCGPNAAKCSASFASGTDVTLTLKPIAGHTYTGWSGACAGVTTDTCTVIIDGPKSVDVSFQ